MKASSNNSTKSSDNGTKLKSAREALTMFQIDIGGSLLTRNRRFLYSRQVQSKATDLQSNSLH